MALNFKDQAERDITQVFHNATEHADVLAFRYDGSQYTAPVILDYTGASERKQASSDHAEGIFLVDVLMYVALADIKVVPHKGKIIEIGEDMYTIAKVETEVGEIILHLEMYDE